ncbi:N-acetyltransferase family protein [candidate division KSB1 bacterium]|nr:N-acetyltransferase family protein [candidate division KSB1 bacterium]
MSVWIRPLEDEDKLFILDILNYYIKTSFAAFAEDCIGQKECDKLIAASSGYPFYVLETDKQEIVGFGRLRPYHPFQTFRKTAVCTYFIMPEHTGLGHGKALLLELIEDAKKMEIKNLLAEISSGNEASLRFHEKMGFQECGRLKRIGCKFGQDFDIVIMQQVL